MGKLSVIVKGAYKGALIEEMGKTKWNTFMKALGYGARQYMLHDKRVQFIVMDKKTMKGLTGVI